MDKHISKAAYYNESLCNVLAPACKHEVKRLYGNVAQDPHNKLLVLRAFQEELAKIHTRPYEDFQELLHRLMDEKSMFWLPDLMKKVVNELCVICGVQDDMVPEVDPVTVLKTCLINTAREIYKQPYLLYDKFERYEYCRNISTFDSLVKASVVKAIHELIPKTFNDDVRSELLDIESVMNEVRSDDDYDDAPSSGAEPLDPEDAEPPEDDMRSVASCCFSLASESVRNEEPKV